MNKVIEKELINSIDNLLYYYYNEAEKEQTIDFDRLNELMHKLMVRRKVLTMIEEEKKK
jgi:hypothetical protein